ncbi:hypothetical protein TNCT_597841 [Trichonephila clavata]|uniref:Uncharacterized protein n=1 Tax=Trichonephila clavata TaxID=2740835 RepID=A0A8X6I2A1_TRICU|nr:hypothetical protein TNCT_597841 [Trichonephila clavata]
MHLPSESDDDSARALLCHHSCPVCCSARACKVSGHGNGVHPLSFLLLEGRPPFFCSLCGVCFILFRFDGDSFPRWISILAIILQGCRTGSMAFQQEFFQDLFLLENT